MGKTFVIQPFPIGNKISELVHSRYCFSFPRHAPNLKNIYFTFNDKIALSIVYRSEILCFIF